MEAQRFKASLDRTARVSTIVFSALILGVIVILVRVMVGTMMPPAAYPLPVVLLVIWLICFLLAPTGYEVTSDNIFVIRRIGRKPIARTNIVQPEVINREDISWSIRTLGVGGLFGYYGKFANRKIGAMTWYLTRRDQPVLIRTKDGNKIVLSPDDRAGFLAALAS